MQWAQSLLGAERACDARRYFEHGWGHSSCEGPRYDIYLVGALTVSHLPNICGVELVSFRPRLDSWFLRPRFESWLQLFTSSVHLLLSAQLLGFRCYQ